MQATIKKILCPTDFSEVGNKAVRYASAMGKAFGAKVILVHTVEPLVTNPMMGHALQMAAEIESELEEQAKKKLTEMASEMEAPEVEKRVLRGHAYLEILELAESEDVDIIILGTHGRSGLSRFFLGSTAEKVVRKAPCPVLTVKPEEQDFVNGDEKKKKKSEEEQD